MEVYKLFLQDLVFLLKERLEEAKKNQALPRDAFYKGRTIGIYHCLDIIKQQAEAFNIPLSKIGLKDYRLEDFL